MRQGKPLFVLLLIAVHAQTDVRKMHLLDFIFNLVVNFQGADDTCKSKTLYHLTRQLDRIENDQVSCWFT
jgi:hypothetical protein